MPAEVVLLRDEKTGKFVNPDKANEKPAEKEPVKPTEEGLKTIASFAESALGITAEPETPEEKAAKAKADADKVAAEKKKTAAAKPAAKAPAPKPAAAPAAPSLEQIAEAAARGVASAIKPKPEEKTVEPKEELTPAQLRKAKILERMEQIHPEECKGYAQRWKENCKKLLTYSQQWEKDHPGQEFDESADEHAEFFDNNGLYEFWEQEDYIEALADMRADEKLDAHSKKTDGRLSELDRRERLREAEPIIKETEHKAIAAFATTISEAVPGIIGEDGQINREKVSELREDYPRAATALDDITFEAGVFYRAWNGLQPWIEKEPVQKINDKHNPMHDEWRAQQLLGSFFAQKEQAMMLNAPEDQRDQHGRQFLPAKKYWELPEENRNAYWTYSFDDLLALRAASLAKIARQAIAYEDQQFAARAKKRGITLPDSPPARGKGNNGNGDGSPENTNGKPDSPSVGSVSRAAVKRNPGTPAEENPLASFAEKAIG